MLRKAVNRRDVDVLHKFSTYSFLEGLIDYAGMFPPSQLPLNRALSNYKDYISQSDSWMTDHFILPLASLADLDKYISLFSKEEPLNVSITVGTLTELKQIDHFISSEVKKIEMAKRKFQNAISFSMVELSLSPSLFTLSTLQLLSTETAKYGLKLFCELNCRLDDNWNAKLKQSLEVIETHNQLLCPTIGYKLRTGGVNANLIPSCKQVAIALVECRDREIPMKFTAGLHHPVRMYRDEVNAPMHGFINVFLSGMLAKKYKLTIEEVEQILLEQEEKSFSFSDEQWGWRDLSISGFEIRKYRKKLFLSYGSCSFDEPRDELREILLNRKDEAYEVVD